MVRGMQMETEKAYSLMYERLVSLLIENLDFERASAIVEVGAGRGQLTIPLVRRLKRSKGDFRLVALDTSTGPYKDALEALKRDLRKEKLEDLVTVVNGDVKNMIAIEAESVDIIISNETLCELNREGLEKAFQEFHRILKSLGEMGHGELILVAENEAQELVINANGYSTETSLPKSEWFSPYSGEVAALMHRTGFINIRTEYLETRVKMDYDTAISKLKEWTVNPSWVEEHLNDLKRFGLELPMEHVVFCEKQRTHPFFVFPRRICKCGVGWQNGTLDSVFSFSKAPPISRIIFGKMAIGRLLTR
jgi:SAM-dependent methyltransferase